MSLKKISVLFALVCGFTCLFASGKSDLPVSADEFSVNKTNVAVGYQLLNDSTKIVFVFDSKANGIENPSKVFVQGTFNAWAKGTAPEWELTKLNDTVWTLECDSALVKIPGNSGFPEFKFYVLTGDGKVLEPNAISKTPGYQMATNNLILFPGDDPATVVDNVKTSQTLKKLSDFDLDNPEDRSILSNVRLVPGTTKLYRGYHPYKMSYSQYDTEETRIALVKEALEEKGIKSIITLSGEEDPIEGKEEVSPYHLAIREAGNQLYINTSYNTVYFKSNGPEFAQVIEDIIKFINTHPGPYYIHCRLGTDRTGTTSAVMAALCGASWEDICADYQRTNLMGIKEFRDYRLLQYSFEQILGKPMSEVENLSKELGDYFIANTSLTQQDIDDLVSNLK